MPVGREITAVFAAVGIADHDLLAQAAKRAGRATSEGIVLTTVAGQLGTMVAVGCETEPVSKNDEFLVHLGNAMRGSLLAGKPYPTAPTPGAASPETAADDRLDQVLFALHQLEGQVQDLRMTVDELRAGKKVKKDQSKKGKSKKVKSKKS